MNPSEELSSAYELTPEQQSRYRNDGHLLLRDVASEHTVASFRRHIQDAVRRYSTENRPLEERDTYGKAFLQVGNLWTRDDEVRQFVLARRYAQLAADLMGVEGVRIYHDQALFKEPGGGRTPWHQDQLYWPLDTASTITMWMPLVDIVPEAGPMTFVTGSHKLGYASKLEISDSSDEFFDTFLRDHDFRLHNYGAMRAGDATFHAGWTLHSAPGNATGAMREVMTIIYYADGAHLVDPDTNARRVDMEELYPGGKGGDLAVSDLTPLVWHGTTLP